MFKEEKDYFLIEEFLKYGVVASFTKRSLGSMSYTDKTTEVNRQRALTLLGLSDKKVVHALQTHTNNVVYLENMDENQDLRDIDGFVTKRKDVAIFTYYADCLPIFALDTKNMAIGIAHSGWRGTYQTMIYSLLNSMTENFNSKKEDILVGLGIGIAIQDYEVSYDFYENFKEKFPKLYDKCFIIENEKYYFDNTKLNYLLALEYGILDKNLIVDNRGVKNADAFSYRINKDAKERSAAIISIKE